MSAITRPGNWRPWRNNHSWRGSTVLARREEHSGHCCPARSASKRQNHPRTTRKATRLGTTTSPRARASPLPPVRLHQYFSEERHPVSTPDAGAGRPPLGGQAVIASVAFYVTATQGKVTAIDTATGAPRWSTDLVLRLPLPPLWSVPQC
jgi:hypothetical protein